MQPACLRRLVVGRAVDAADADEAPPVDQLLFDRLDPSRQAGQREVAPQFNVLDGSKDTVQSNDDETDRDQTLVNRMVELGQLSPEEAVGHPDSNQVLQAVGTRTAIEPGRCKLKLVPGDCITIEPGLYRQGYGGVRLEDNVLVTGSGFENLTNYPYDLAP